MSIDVIELMRFYESPLGNAVGRLLGRALGEVWGDMHGRRLLGIGYAVPYLAALGTGAERVLAFMPPRQGVRHWPDAALSASAMADPLLLPLPEASIDRVLVVHALEASQEPAELMDEIARILTPEGRAILVCPNRRGLWARMDSTPFGHGQPFSRKQIRRLIHGTQLEACAWREAIYVPPLANGLVVRSAATWERVGRGLSLPFAGLHLVETAKRLHRPVAVRARRLRAAREPALMPVPASRTAAATPPTTARPCGAVARRQ
jgi:SAM-dependent methyltransferase